MITSQVLAFPDPFPARLNRVLSYGNVHTPTASATPYTTGTAGVFRLNDLYLPISGGHQPYGLDQLATLYSRWKVTRVRVDFTVWPHTSVSDVGGLVVTFVPPGSAYDSSATAGNTYVEKPNSHLLMTSTSPVTHTFEFPISDLAQVSRSEFASNLEEYCGTFAASPTRVVTMQVAAISKTAAASVAYTILLHYTTEVYERIVLAQS